MKATFRKLFLFALVITTAIVCFAFSACALDSTGKCGENVYWQYNAEIGELVISGEGKMTDYTSTTYSPFSKNDDIKAVVIEDGVTTVGKYAFWACKGISYVSLPDSITSINAGAFSFCTSLKSIILPEGLTDIKTEAFYNSGLTSIELPETLQTLGYRALNNDKIKKVHIPASVTTIADDAFPTLWFKEITVDKNNPNYMSENGVLYNKEQTVLICYPSGKEETDYILPATVTSFDVEVFNWCNNLENIFVEEGNENYSSENGVLFNKDKTTLVKYPNDKKDNLYSIPSGVINIGTYAFFQSNSFAKVEIPNSVISIERYAFAFSSFKEIEIADSVTSIGFYAFGYCDFLTKIVIPDNLESLSSSLFYSCHNLKDVTIGKGVKTISGSAFSYSPVETVHYAGTLEEWNAIKGKDYLSSASLHLIAEKEGSAPNCTESGYTSGTYCALCDKWYTGHNEIEATGHLNTKKYPEEKPTCSDKGFTAGTYCNDCEVWIEGHEEISEISHKNEYIVDELPATCTTDGYTIGTYCPDCESWTMGHDEIPAIEHKNKALVAESAPSCNSVGYTSGMYCPDCKQWLIGHEEIPETVHNFGVTLVKATLTQDGSITKLCTLCNEVIETTTIPYIETIKLSSTKVTYNGKERTPSVTVKDSEGNILTKDTDYTVAYAKGRKLPGEYTITVEFAGNYEGEKSLTFTILPKAPTSISATQSTSVIKFSWAESKGATGYRVYQYSPSKGKYVQIASIKGSETYRKTSLKAGTIYKFKVKPYTKLSDGTVLWGSASSEFITATECKAPKVTAVISPSKSKAAVEWSNVSGETGFQLYYATSKNGTYKKVGSYSADTLFASKTFSASASGKTIYFKVRAYQKVDGQTIYSEWSTVKSVKLK